MEFYKDGEWISMDDFTSHDWDEFENFESLVERESDYVDYMVDTDELVDRLMTDDDFYDNVVGWF